MIARRDLVLAALGLGALATAEALRPRKRLVLLKGGKIEDAIPTAFAGWEAETVSELVRPEMAGRLAKTLYSETVARTYFDERGAAIMVLAAYGDTQSDLLQLHRPESCYPAVGFALRMQQSVNLALPGGGALPARKVVAAKEDRQESIVYWTRMGEELPQTGEDQRSARLKNAVKGYVPDGILVRCSTMGDPTSSFALLERFVADMLKAVPKDKLPALVGTRIANGIA